MTHRLTCAAVVLSAVPAFASIIFDNVNLHEGEVAPGPFLAAEFTPDADYQLTGVQVAVFNAGGAIDLITFSLLSDNAGVPGGLISQIGTTIAPSNDYNLVDSGSPTTPIDLDQGTPYWLELTLSPGLSWVLGAQLDLPFESGESLGSWQPGFGAPQFEVDGLLISPEPSGCLLVPLGLVLCFIKKKGSK